MQWLLLIGAVSVLFFGMLACYELAHRLSIRRISFSEPKAEEGGIGVVDGAVFALLGLLLAFQFSAAGGRMDYRRQLGVQEANAISTAYARLDLLPVEDRDALRDLLRQYTDARIRFRQAMPDVQATMAEHRASQQLHGQIWSRAVTGCKSQSSAPSITVVLLPALNEMGDLAASQVAAALTHSPLLLSLFTCAIALVTAALAGAVPARSRRSWAHFILFSIAVCLTIYVILEIEFPRLGLITVASTDQILLDVRRSMDQ